MAAVPTAPAAQAAPSSAASSSAASSSAASSSAASSSAASSSAAPSSASTPVSATTAPAAPPATPSTPAPSAPPAPPSHAAQRTFDVAELIELILQELPLRDLLLVQRVCRSFHAAVASSKKLQRLLFFIANTDQVLVYDTAINEGDWPDVDWVDKVTSAAAIPTRNPFLDPLFRSLEAESAAAFVKRLSPPWARREASWRRMLISQPPVEGVLQIRWGNWFGGATARHDQIALDGPRAGQLPAMADKVRKKRARGYTGHDIWPEAEIVGFW